VYYRQKATNAAMASLPPLTTFVLPDSKYVDVARKRNATIQQFLQVYNHQPSAESVGYEHRER